ncbi:hypothetical protein [Microbulbifer discodermiae]|uniref:hypothetical protein n=1 Tax=Microbulbifer sp. 2201CG32-9 TaxID=3232309 RepID=UPI00345B521F
MTNNIITDNLGRPEVLEKIYRDSPEKFESLLQESITHNAESETLRVWYARLSYSPSISVQKISITLLVALCLAAGFLAKLSTIFSFDDQWYYPRFIPLVVVGTLICYFLITTVSSAKTRNLLLAVIIGCVVYILVLPRVDGSASITMALIHLPLFYLSLLAVSFMNDGWNRVEERLNFIRYIGEMFIYSVLVLLGGVVLTAITLGLFSLIDISIESWYMNYIVVWGLVSAPLVATYLFDSIQSRQSKFAPILSNVFSPLFLITVIAYLVAAIYQGKSPFSDRDFLIIFNGLLLIILALTIFSVAGKKTAASIQVSDYINVALIGATLLVNIIALVAILFRWMEYGITVNRIVVAGANILIFVHLMLLLTHYVNHLRGTAGINRLEAAIAGYLPVYTAWSLVVAVVLPLVFWFQ